MLSVPIWAFSKAQTFVFMESRLVERECIKLIEIKYFVRCVKHLRCSVQQTISRWGRFSVFAIRTTLLMYSAGLLFWKLNIRLHFLLFLSVMHMHIVQRTRTFTSSYPWWLNMPHRTHYTIILYYDRRKYTICVLMVSLDSLLLAQ